MSSKYSSGKNSIAECDVCGFRYKLTELRALVIKTKITGIMACPECYDPDHPQLQLGMYPVEDNYGVRNPRPDQAGYYENGNDGTGGSRMSQWGFNPVGGGFNFVGNNEPSTELNIPNALVTVTSIGHITATAS